MSRYHQATAAMIQATTQFAGIAREWCAASLSSPDGDVEAESAVLVMRETLSALLKDIPTLGLIFQVPALK